MLRGWRGLRTVGLALLVLTLLVAQSGESLVSAVKPSPQLLVHQASVVPGGVVDVSGSKFPSKSTVSLYWDNTPQGVALATPKGSLEFRFTVPADSTLDFHELRAVSDQVEAKVTINVVAATIPTPEATTPPASELIPSLTPTTEPTATSLPTAAPTTAEPTAIPLPSATPVSVAPTATPSASPTQVTVEPTSTPLPITTPAAPPPTQAPTATATPVTPEPSPAPGAADPRVFDDSFGLGWGDASWSGAVNLQDTAYVQSGSNAASFTLTQGWGAFSPALVEGNTLDTSPYTHLRFFVNGGSAGGQAFQVLAHYPGGTSWGPPARIENYVAGGAISANEWRLVNIPLSVLGVEGTVTDMLAIQDVTGQAQPTIYLDGMEFYNATVAGTPVATQVPTATPQPTALPTSTPTPTASPTVVATPSSKVTVDFAVDEGPVTHRATGFIGADITDTQPPDSVFLPLRPQLLSWVMQWRGINRATQNDIKYQIKLWNKALIPTSATGDWSKWESYVRTKAQEALSNNYHTAEFDVWNEPEFADYWDGSIDERYYQMWIRAYRQIKNVKPDFLVAGPSTTNLTWMKNSFLTRMKAENALPDILTWHEMNAGEGVSQRVRDMRTYLQAQGMNISKISINEYMSSSYNRKPGAIVRFMDELEAAGVDSAARACWQEGGDWNCAVHLDNVLTYPDQQPRSAWWTYKSYAEMSGRMVGVANSSSVVGIASEDAGLGKGHVLLGSLAATADVAVDLVNLDSAPFYSPGAPIKLTVYRIPNSENNALSAPILEQQTTVTPSGSSLSLSLTNVQQYSAYLIILTR